MIHGNTAGISNALLKELEALSEMKVEREDYVSPEVVVALTWLTGRINREISVYLNRRGEILDVSVGEINQVHLIPMGLRRSSERLSGIRCIHTHPGGSGILSKVDLNALSEMKFDAMTALGVQEGRFSEGYAALLCPPKEEEPYTIFGPLGLDALCSPVLMQEILSRDRRISTPDTVDAMGQTEERAVLVGLDDDGSGAASLDELAELALTAGAQVLHREVQNRRMPDPATYIGRGKAAELALCCQGLGANLLICDDELSAAQMKNLEEILGLKVIDRTALILEIFSKRAISREGKLQVELAQLKYRLPRLTGMGLALSRLGGGIGTRGPGEKKLETDRRHIRRRIHEIEGELQKVKERRQSLRERRTKEGLPICALVGYTNSGKSTLLNALTGSDVLAEDKLFATLDPVSRGLTLPSGQGALLVDTVGFVDKLPHDLVDAFHATLEEVVHADLLLHLVDGSSPKLQEHMLVVRRVLAELGASQPVLTVFNKMDAVADRTALPAVPHTAEISAREKTGLEELLQVLEQHLPRMLKSVGVRIPYDQGQLRSLLHSQGQVTEEAFEENGVRMEVMVDAVLYSRVKSYLV